MLSWLLLLPAAPAAPAWFFSGTGDEVEVIDEKSTVRGMPVRRTGHLVARVEDPQEMRLLAEVGEVVVLGGDGHVVRVRPRAGVDEIALSRVLHERADVAWALPDLALPMVPHDLPNDPFVADQWHLLNTGQRGWTPLVDINAPLAWEASTGVGAIIAVMDSGVDSDHPDLDVIVGWDYNEGDDDSNPDVTTENAAHGTSAAGIAAARGNNGIGVAGVAYDATVYGVRLLGGNGGALSNIYAAFAEAVDAGAWVINNSWGFGGCSLPSYPIFLDAMKYAETRGRNGLGTAVVFSAGNDNCDITDDGLQALPEVISVAATNGNDDREWYSNFGTFVDISAPSGGTLTTDIAGPEGYGSWRNNRDYWGWFSGTSAAAPVVSGVLALMFSANPRLSAAKAREVLCQTAVKIDIENGYYDETGWSWYYGCGRIDAGAAVMAVKNAPPQAPAILAPKDEAWVGRVVLQWAPAADADGDALQYQVTWWIDGGDDDPVVARVEGDTHLDLTGEVAAGDVVVFMVHAEDLWGPGATSGPDSFEVVYPIVLAQGLPATGCECRSAGSAPPAPCFLALSVLAVLFWARRG